ncbi:MAG: D-sedoheptulose 7-phosphate isomerase [Bacteroidia bacterium]|nr:D-sedoheptulose 7-phosphate isomerase [Bacteroidia bacterium]
MANQRILSHFTEAQNVLQQFISNEQNIERIEAAGNLMLDSLRNGGKIISCGNGGSHCDAMHFAEELTGRYRENRPAFAAIAISDVSHITCVGNDYGFDQVFSRFIEGMGKPSDCLLAISTSGNSANVVKAAEVAKAMGIKVIALTGKDGGKLAALADIEIRAPHSAFADRVQEIHIKIIHSLIDFIEQGY